MGVLGLNCKIALVCVIKKLRFDLIREAIRLLLDNPDLSNREIARQVGVSEPTIRYWKKQPFWEHERQKLINDRAEIMELNKAEQRREYKENLEKQRRNLEILMDQVFANSMRAITLSNKVYATACMMDDPLKACSVAIKSGAHTQAKAAIQGITAYIDIMNHLYQTHILIEYFEGLEEGD